MLQADTVHGIGVQLPRQHPKSVSVHVTQRTNSYRLIQNKKPQISPNSQRKALCKKVTTGEGGGAQCIIHFFLFGFLHKSITKNRELKN